MAGPWDIVGDVAGGIARGAREVAGVFDIGEPSGNDHASCNWAAWGHEEIRSMLDTSVDQWSASRSDAADHTTADGSFRVVSWAGEGRGAAPGAP